MMYNLIFPHLYFGRYKNAASSGYTIYLVLYLLVEKSQRHNNLEWEAPELMEAGTKVNNPVSIRAHEVYYLICTQ